MNVMRIKEHKLRLPAVVSIITFVCIVFPTISFAQPQDAEFIDALKRTNASSLEKGLPDMAVPLWLEKTFEQRGKITWEVNDCGEGGDGRIAPVCVEIQIPQKSGYVLHVSSIVGNTEGQTVKPQLFMVYFYKSEGHKTLDIINVSSVAEAVRLYRTDLSEKKKNGIK